MVVKRIFFLTVIMPFLVVKLYAQVNLQTGSAVFALPMFSWQDNKSRLTTVVALNYNSGNGLRVNDVASNVGQGWSLIAGGVISRMQVGEPDDQPAYFNTSKGSEQDDDLTKYPAGYLYHTINPALGCANAMARYPIYKNRNQLYSLHNLVQEDKQLDHFSFQFNGKSGMFVLDTTGGYHAVPLGDTKLKITFQTTSNMSYNGLGIRTTISSFTVQDVDGLQYRFSTLGLTRVLNEEFTDKYGTTPIAQPSFKSGNVYYQAGFVTGYNNKTLINPYVVSNWYLTDITDPFTSRKVTFHYTNRSISNTAGYDISYNQWHGYVIVTNKTSVTVTPQVDTVRYPDGHMVALNYSPVDRFDMAGDKPLQSVDVTYQGRFISKYLVNTTYFIWNRFGTPSLGNQFPVGRLCLRSVKKIGVDMKEDTPPYMFDYYTGSNNADDFVPPPFFYAKDIWGFYNGSSSVLYDNSGPIPLTYSSINQLSYAQLVSLCFVNNTTANSYTDPRSGQPVYGVYLNPKPGLAQNGLLKQVIYPTGGSLAYQYAQNTGNLKGTGDVTVGGVHVSQTSSVDGGFSNGCSNPIITNYNYVLNGTGSASSLWGLEMPVNMLVSGSYYAAEQKGFHCTWSSGCGCYWHYTYPGILSVSEAISLSSLQNFMNAVAPVLTVLSAVMDVLDVINLCLDNGPWAIVAVALDIVGTVFTIILSCSRPTKEGSTPIYHNANFNDGSPLPMQFKRVEITESSGAIGKTIQIFTSTDDYPLWITQANTTYAPKQRFAPWAYGLPKQTLVYDSAGAIVKQTVNKYDFTKAKTQINNASCKCLVQYSSSERNADWTQPVTYAYNTSNYITASNSNILVDVYNMYTGRVELDTTYETAYNPSTPGQSLTRTTVFLYNSVGNYDVKDVGTWQSNGDTMHNIIKYSSDYNTGVLSTLVGQNIVSLKVATSNYVKKAGSSIPRYLNEKVTEFVQVTGGDIKPSRVIEQRFTAPVTSYTAYNGPTGTNYSGYKIPQAYSYDANANLTGVVGEGNRSVVNIYDYNDKYIVAAVINADPAADKPAYTSFESLDLSRSGWAASGGSNYYNLNVPSPTGNNTYSLLANGANSLTASSLNSSKSYILSFWSSNANFTIGYTGYSLAKSGPTINNFTYYEYNLPAGGTSVTISNTTTGAAANIDELRLYPSTARMRTVTYDPVIGKTSECDENNRITYYTYDNLGRLRFIKDESGNIVKMYEYNNVSAIKQQGCPTTYYNHMLSEAITRTNCSAGYLAGTATYTVPANRYTSTLSQEGADVQAEMELLTNGPAYANTNGSCTLIYYNVAMSQSFTTDGCAEGYIAGSVTYTVPAGRYWTTVSQDSANKLAQIEIDANGQNYANTIASPPCTVDTSAHWTWEEGAPTYCLSVNGALPPHQFVLTTNINPNSTTYNQTMWQDAGPQDACPANTYYNSQQSQTFTRNNCANGYTGGSVTYTVPAGTYGSTTSQAAADQLATNDINANGQNYANTNGACTASQKSGHLFLGTASSGSAGFTTSSVNTITLTLDPDPGTIYSLNYTLSGPSTKTGTLCVSRTSTTCSQPATVTFTNMPVGTYTLNVYLNSGSSSYKGITYTYY